ncbi:hypothetical protein V2H45_05590 [Tumidithrix elongata RA019]|uniref:Uncharacterized protein n=1 Tax=Tumidithrix elongata BACA0141 TaxID=2716417 RepID=A0AAW9PYB4_9CYAN|nr:hypothetical protein [Tumidithrix elongata RA019]
MRYLFASFVTACLILLIFLSFIGTDSAFATPRRPIQPEHGAKLLSGTIRGDAWLEAAPESKLAYCQEAFIAFRGSPSQSYIISHNVQSLTPEGLCDRIDQYFSLEDNLDTRLGSAAAIAPILFADTPLGTKY